MYGALYGQHPMIQGIALLQDLKLGQYVKLAPRVTFSMQLLGTVIGAVLNCTFLEFRYLLRMFLSNAEIQTLWCWQSSPTIEKVTNHLDFQSQLKLTVVIALLSVSGTRLWSGQNAQGYNCEQGLLHFELGSMVLQQMLSRGVLSLLRCSVPTLRTRWSRSLWQLGSSFHSHFTLLWVILPSTSTNWVAEATYFIFSIVSGPRLGSTTWTLQSLCNTRASSPSVSIPPSSRHFPCTYNLLLIYTLWMNYSPSMVIGIFSQWFVRTKYPRWFTKYKCVLLVPSQCQLECWYQTD